MNSLSSKDGNTKLLSILAHLLRLTSNSNPIEGTDAGKKIKLVIGKCIGEIGPIDFHSLALPVSEGRSKAFPSRLVSFMHIKSC